METKIADAFDDGKFNWEHLVEDSTEAPDHAIGDCVHSGNVQGFIAAISDINVNHLVYVKDVQLPTILTWYVMTSTIRFAYSNVSTKQSIRDLNEEKRVLMMRHLVEDRKASVDDHFGREEVTLLHMAKTTPICRLLLENKANANSRDRLGRTPLMHATRNMLLPSDMVLTLLENKADPNLETYDGKNNSLFALGTQPKQGIYWWKDAYVGASTNSLYQYWKNQLENALDSVTTVNVRSVS